MYRPAKPPERDGGFESEELYVQSRGSSESSSAVAANPARELARFGRRRVAAGDAIDEPAVPGVAGLGADQVEAVGFGRVGG